MWSLDQSFSHFSFRKCNKVPVVQSKNLLLKGKLVFHFLFYDCFSCTQGCWSLSQGESTCPAWVRHHFIAGPHTTVDNSDEPLYLMSIHKVTAWCYCVPLQIYLSVPPTRHHHLSPGTTPHPVSAAQMLRRWTPQMRCLPDLGDAMLDPTEMTNVTFKIKIWMSSRSRTAHQMI